MPRFKKKSEHLPNTRFTLLQVFFFVLMLVLIGRLFYVQIIRHTHYQTLAQVHQQSLEELIPKRGAIYTIDYNSNNQENTTLAESQESYLLYAIPAKLQNASSTISTLDDYLEFKQEEIPEIVKRLQNRKDPYEPIKSNLTKEQKQIILELDIKGLGFEPQRQRVYPQKNSASHLTGFLGFRGNQRLGQYGLEEYYQDLLAGHGGLLKTERDPRGRLIGFEGDGQQPLVDGQDLYLNIDSIVQFKTCEILNKWKEKMAAEGANLVILNPKNGQVLSLCNLPSFDANNYSQVEDIDIYLNKAISQSYEPGSVFKVFTMAAALDLGLVNPNTEYLDQGFVKIGEHTIYNANKEKYGQVNMTQVLENSINTGTIFVANKIGYENFKKYVKNFGFGSLTNIDLPAEHAGDISSLSNRGEIYLATGSYGQGISVTPIQLASAFAAIANGGILWQPQVLNYSLSTNGEKNTHTAQKVRRVISSKTSNILKAMMVSVVKNGHGNKATVDGYYVAGKTGTANISKSSGGYSNQTNHTFAGFAPADNPRFVAVVKFNKPKNVSFSSDSAAPAFAEIAQFLLNYYQVPPDY